VTYSTFRDTIQRVLRENRSGLTWKELRERAGLEGKRACPTWTRQLEEEIGLVRREKTGRELIWRLD